MLNTNQLREKYFDYLLESMKKKVKIRFKYQLKALLSRIGHIIIVSRAFY